ncbi:hypothetical protein BD309DRAFT_316434 [Dichomitus squalens]|nr:hypothetical protein BD309DRAFT_316434 [Dichomitus squalens]
MSASTHSFPSKSLRASRPITHRSSPISHTGLYTCCISRLIPSMIDYLSRRRACHLSVLAEHPPPASVIDIACLYCTLCLAFPPYLLHVACG